MKILPSGSFLNLENREKVEELIFTAKELARAAVAADGFVNSPAANQRLALECWQGAEYVTRAHEEATIKNIFLSNFLQQLRDLPKQPTQLVSSFSATVSDNGRNQVVTPSSNGSSTSDEFLGLVESNGSDSNETVRSRSYADECIPPGEVEAPTGHEDETLSVDGGAAVSTPERSAETPKPMISADTEENQDETPPDLTEDASIPAVVESIVLTEKEPYNFDSCTVTAVVQLLPVKDDKRRCVISVRTHDFTPQITITDLRVNQFADDIKNALDASYSQYRNDLPARSAEKLKKEKTASKKRSTKPSEPAKQNRVSPESKANVSETNAANTTPVGGAATPTDQASLFAGG